MNSSIIKVLSKAEELVLLLISLCVFFIGAYSLYDNYLIYKGANNDDLLRYKPTYEGDEPLDKPIKGKMVAWLTIDDSAIDYPIMQGKTNTEFLTTNPFGEYSLSGSIFLDCRNDKDFKNQYSLVYGHHMDMDVMFGSLDKYLNEDYFNKHQTGKLIVGSQNAKKSTIKDRTYNLNIFAVLETEATNEEMFSPVDTDIKLVMQYIRDNSLYINEDALQPDSKIIALSTCKFPDTAERTVVIGMLEKE